MTQARAVLTINAGSSSVKFALYVLRDGDDPVAKLSGQVESIGEDARFSARDARGTSILADDAPSGRASYEAVVRFVVDWCRTHLGDDAHLVAAGHRFVHGGRDFVDPVIVDDAVLARLEGLAPFAPLHAPHNVAGVRMMRDAAPDVVNVACFDTAFHAKQSATARRFGLPRELESEGIVRYGFHGLSYEYIARRLRELDPASARARTIVAHLGNGASLCAMRDGASVATTMGFSVLDGLVMGTRCGALDPGAVLYLLREKRYDAAALERVLYHDSGLLGISGISSDMRALRASSAPTARDAIDSFVERLVREIGALAAANRGLDALVFTAGIGEHDAALRAEACSALAWLGVELDGAANARAIGSFDAARIGSGRVVVWVIPTDEDLSIARHVSSLLPNVALKALESVERLG
jgi:acetate kinase